MFAPASLAFLPEALLSTWSPNHGVGPEIGGIIVGGTAASAAWPAANRALYMPLYIDRPGVVTKLWVHNGATASGNIDIGLYSDFASGVFSLLTSSGSTAQAGTNVIQEFDITDFPLGPGVYMLGLAQSTNTGTFRAMAPGQAGFNSCIGLTQEAAALPLPATATPVTPANMGFYPMAGIAFRTLVA